MVEKELTKDLLLEQMRSTAGFSQWKTSMREEYLRLARKLLYSCASEVEMFKVKAGMQSLKDAMELSGMSKEDVNKWMELR